MITIQRTPLSYRLRVSEQGTLMGTGIQLHQYLRRFQHDQFDRKLMRYIPYRRYTYYDVKSEMLYLPGYDFESFCGFLGQNNVAYTVEHLPLQLGKVVNITMRDGIQDKDEQQTNAINYLSTHEGSLRGLSLNTGSGKTYSAIKTTSRIKRRAIILVGGLIDQWRSEIFKFTNLKEEDVYVIQGAQSLLRLLLQIDRMYHPKIILCSLGTIRAYALGKEQYENYPPFNTFFDLLSIGVKIIDEAHLDFYLTLMIDLQTNAAVNIPLTATFDRGEQKVKEIYDAHYPTEIRFGEGVFDRYVDIYSYSYSLNGMVAPKHYMSPMGYNHSKLEEWLLRRGQDKLNYIWTYVYEPILHSRYFNIMLPGQKLLVLCSTLLMCKWLQDKIIAGLPAGSSLRVAIYDYEASDDVLVTSDIIVSTLKSAGTGRDIKNLKTVLMTIATGSNTANRQTLGRLRKLVDQTPIYAYAWCRDIKQHVVYHGIRKAVYITRGLIYKEYNV